jgi:hypothetical protein
MRGGKEREIKMEIHVLPTSTCVDSLTNPHRDTSKFIKESDILALVEVACASKAR